MGRLLTTDSIMICPHFGTVRPVSANTRVSAMSAPILRSTDTFAILGCTMNISGVPHPCVVVKWISTAGRSNIGDPTLTEDSVGLCQAADQAVQGQVQVVETQPRVSGL